MASKQTSKLPPVASSKKPQPQTSPAKNDPKKSSLPKIGQKSRSGDQPQKVNNHVATAIVQEAIPSANEDLMELPKPADTQIESLNHETVINIDQTKVSLNERDDAENCQTNSTLAAQNVESTAPVESTDQPLLNLGNGEITLIYEQYNELFPISNGQINHEAIDEVYCLSFVMPDCRIRLSKQSTQQLRELPDNLPPEAFFVQEDPVGQFQNLIAGERYYVHVEQDRNQLLRDQAAMRKVATQMEGAALSSISRKDDGRVIESCSCIYGNPCVDEYGCKDWGNRYAIASKNGWKGF